MVKLPECIHSVVNSRTDRLAPSTQMVLKVASVLDAEFTVPQLAALYPIRIPHVLESIGSELEVLTKLDLVLERDGAKLMESIYHVPQIVQEVVYYNILFEQRRELHTSMASYYVKKHETHGDAPDNCCVSAAKHFYAIVRMDSASHEKISDMSLALKALAYIKKVVVLYTNGVQYASLLELWSSRGLEIASQLGQEGISYVEFFSNLTCDVKNRRRYK